MNQFYKNLSIWLVICLIGFALINVFNPPTEAINQINYNDFLDSIKSGKVSQVTINGNEATAQDLAGNRFKTVMPENLETVQPFLAHGVKVKVEQEKKAPWYMEILISWLPMLLLMGVWIYFMRQSQAGGGKGLMTFGKSRARLIEGEESKITFADVAGIEEASDELGEIVDFLRDPAMFTRVGARIPKGVLLSGEPGTGKTLLAKAIAGEAKVPFFSISGSDFVEMYVGVGASRVRDLFKEAKKKAPCIIFIDEIDAVGRQRGVGVGGGNDEREQTLNQLLVEMDGFEANAGIIIVAATNRPDILDPALKRPGRFDRQVIVPIPDVRGREKILKVHAAKVQLDTDVDLAIIAKGTPGFSGAELANMVNEAALMAARFKVGKITMDLMERAKDKVMMGAERTSMILTAKDKAITAYHEAGHALVARLLPGTDPVHKVTIIPRGRALGLTMQLPTDEKHSQSRSFLMNNLCILLGGRVAEELIFGDVTTGAANDIERASAIARKMVCEWGMSEEIGLINVAGPDEHGRGKQAYSGETAVRIDKAVVALVQEARETATTLLSENRAAMQAMADALLEKETISGDDIDRLMTA
ncbi:ATP-dependent zinc metalloprotease FtsH [Thiovibrio sp. JS02]